ncbi:MAG: restriction endonuclease subunit S, partial [Candidatus Latescibacterota bacterium]
MGSEWITTTIGEFCPLSYGKALPERARNSAGRVPVYGSNGIVGYHDKALTDGPTIIIGRKGTVGAVHFSPKPCWPIDTTFFVTSKDTQKLRFKYYLLKSLGLDRMNADSAVPGLNRDAAHACKVRVPPFPEQRAIAHILGTLDDKIELNRRMNETLEAMARALFKSWFVDFDPVIDNALAAGNPIPEALAEKAKRRLALGDKRKPLPEHIRCLFPDRFVDSELG